MEAKVDDKKFNKDLATLSDMIDHFFMDIYREKWKEMLEIADLEAKIRKEQMGGRPFADGMVGQAASYNAIRFFLVGGRWRDSPEHVAKMIASFWGHPSVTEIVDYLKKKKEAEKSGA